MSTVMNKPFSNDDDICRLFDFLKLRYTYLFLQNGGVNWVDEIKDLIEKKGGVFIEISGYTILIESFNRGFGLNIYIQSGIVSERIQFEDGKALTAPDYIGVKEVEIILKTIVTLSHTFTEDDVNGGFCEKADMLSALRRLSSAEIKFKFTIRQQWRNFINVW